MPRNKEVEVFAVLVNYDYEGSELLGVFGDAGLALDFVYGQAAPSASESYEIQKRVLNSKTDEYVIIHIRERGSRRPRKVKT